MTCMTVSLPPRIRLHSPQHATSEPHRCPVFIVDLATSGHTSEQTICLGVPKSPSSSGVNLTRTRRISQPAAPPFACTAPLHEGRAASPHRSLQGCNGSYPCPRRWGCSLARARLCNHPVRWNSLFQPLQPPQPLPHLQMVYWLPLLAPM